MCAMSPLLLCGLCFMNNCLRYQFRAEDVNVVGNGAISCDICSNGFVLHRSSVWFIASRRAHVEIYVEYVIINASFKKLRADTGCLRLSRMLYTQGQLLVLCECLFALALIITGGALCSLHPQPWGHKPSKGNIGVPVDMYAIFLPLLFPSAHR